MTCRPDASSTTTKFDVMTSAGQQPRSRTLIERLNNGVFALSIVGAGALTGAAVVPGVGLPNTAQVQANGDAVVHYGQADHAELAELAVEGLWADWSPVLPGWRLEFVSGSGDVAGFTWSHEQRIEVFVRPGDNAGDLERVLAHELGHALDVTMNDGNERRSWLRSRGQESTDWWPTSGAADFETGAGDFAEVFAVWTGAIEADDLADFRSRVAAPPDEADLQLMAELLGDRRSTSS